MVPNMIQIACFSFLLHFVPWTQAELFTAIAQMEPLLETHKRILDDLDDYILKEEKRLAVLKSHLEVYRIEHEKAMEDIPNYLGNPINAFTLIKRLTTDLDDIEDSIKIGTEYIKNITMNHADVKYPTSEDMAGAAQALTRLQDTYRLDVHDLSEGILNGIKYSFSMTAADCFELSRALYNLKDYKNALAWSMETLRKFKKEKFAHTFSEVDILEYISFSHYLMGDVKTALEWTKKLLEIDPKHPRAQGNIPHYEKTIKEQEQKAKQKQRGEMGEEGEKPKDTDENRRYRKERETYEALCRGEMDISSDIAKRLTCRYMTENHPFLRLAPFKVEQMYIKPDVFVFHQVLSDEEIEFIQDMAMPRFKRAVVHDPKTGELVPAPYRISKSAWLRDDESPVVARVSRRVAHMTGLAVTSAEELQVVNYGIGGHYEPHYDFARSAWLRDEESPVVARVSRRVAHMTGLAVTSAEELQVVNYGIGGHYEPHYDFARKYENAFNNFDGNRIATVLFYMSEVAQGGATVFTELGLSVFPVKNAALFWMNLHPSGEGDMATRHAACPVLRGSKWVCNKWLHQGGQEFLKPCNLDYQEEGIIRKIPRAIPKTSR